MPTRYWIIVASRDHVLTGVRQGIAQSNHGKASALRRMHRGDGIIYYSPKEVFGEPTPCRRFTAIGYVADDALFQVDMGDGFEPFRRRVDYKTCREVDVVPLVPDLTFIKNKSSWGYVFRFGTLEVPEEDFERIARLMLEGDEGEG